MLLGYLSTFFSYKISHVQSPIFFSVQVRSAKTSALSKLFSFIQINFFYLIFCVLLYISVIINFYLYDPQKKKNLSIFTIDFFFSILNHGYFIKNEKKKYNKL